MSKSDSHQFSGTKGQKISQGMEPSNLKKQIAEWASEVVQRMSKNVSKSKREKFNTACVAFDESTGELYFGRNGGIKKFKKEIHPDLKKILPPTSLNNYKVGNCAEVDAINNALYAGAKLSNLHITTIHTTESRFAQDKPSCENCTYAFKGRIKKNNTGWKE